MMASVLPGLGALLFTRTDPVLRWALCTILWALPCAGCNEGSEPLPPAGDADISKELPELPDTAVRDIGRVDETDSTPSMGVLILDQAMSSP